MFEEYKHLEGMTDGYWVWDLSNPDYEYMSPRFRATPEERYA